ncbi:MAG: helix-turn-helix transcriptional regulator [Clostridia bacterium]|nr:helix-turn-helix transcriptional regulator [Clostridia bacterium]MBQ9847882.1 helix-turn-helix transcriptional regulator [Clostridia bacterium]
MSVKDAVAERFLQICKERNIKLNELANRSGVTPSTAYSMVDKSRRDVSVVTVKKFCDGLDISLREFFDSEIFDSLEQEIV